VLINDLSFWLADYREPERPLREVSIETTKDWCGRFAFLLMLYGSFASFLRARKLLKTALAERLEKQDPTHADRNRFPLRRPSPYAAYELRVESWRVFYQIVDEEVQITLIGRKEGNRLIIEGEEFKL
jgi:mRNA-degrading endonuclease RelE of RelBE toxin-antitoxin system